jgi:hypothetical protein
MADLADHYTSTISAEFDDLILRTIVLLQMQADGRSTIVSIASLQKLPGFSAESINEIRVRFATMVGPQL